MFTERVTHFLFKRIIAVISRPARHRGFLVIFDKPLSPDITTLTINTLVGAIRGTLGYVDDTGNNTNLLANYTCSLTKIANNMARLGISKGSVMNNATNNTPVNLYGGTLTVTFS